MKTETDIEFEDASESSTHDDGSTSAWMAMIAGIVLLLLMFAA